MYPYYGSKNHYHPNPITYYPYSPSYINFPQSYDAYSRNKNQYPTVNTKQITASANSFQKLMKDADKVINKFANSKDFSYKVMDAAQKSNKEEVKKLIQGTGIEHPVKISFNPDGIRLSFIAKTEQIDCCKLDMSLHW